MVCQTIHETFGVRWLLPRQAAWQQVELGGIHPVLPGHPLVWMGMAGEIRDQRRDRFGVSEAIR
jgi:hypothetical protein